jgi:anti-anti-sigma factor
VSSQFDWLGAVLRTLVSRHSQRDGSRVLMAVTELSCATLPARASVESSTEGGRIVLWLGGEHDLSTQDFLSTRLARAIASLDADVVVDLSEIEFMDAGTVGVLLRARELLLLRSRLLALRAPSRRARLVIGLCGLDHLVDAVPTKPA